MTRQSHEDDDDDRPLISPKLLVVAITVFAIGLLVGAYGLFFGRSADPRAEIQGEVTLDGAPLAEGSILFMPVDGKKGFSAGGEIKNGNYQIAQAEGPGTGLVRVEIRGQKKTGRQVPNIQGQPGDQVDEVVEAVAERFNVKSDLRHEVKRGSNVANFKVESK